LTAAQRQRRGSQTTASESDRKLPLGCFWAVVGLVLG